MPGHGTVRGKDEGDVEPRQRLHERPLRNMTRSRESSKPWRGDPPGLPDSFATSRDEGRGMKGEG